MRLSGELKRRVLYREVLEMLRQVDAEAKQEVTFSSIMPTKRRFRADFYCPNLRLIVEVNGGQWTGGRHTRGGKGYENDLAKINLAQLHGFKVIQMTYEMLERGELFQVLNQIKCK